MIVAAIAFSLYLLSAFIILGLITFILTQTFKFGFISTKTRRIGVSISAIVIILLVFGLIALFMIDWSAWP